MSTPVLKQRNNQPQSRSLNFPYTTINRVLGQRGVLDNQQVDYGLANLLPPNKLTGIDEAAQLLSDAITADARVMIVGDFDADGATSCALAMKCLKAFGLKQISYLVPSRFEYGYGLSPEIVGVAAAQQPDIIITVDNGISSIEGVYTAQQLGISVLVTDHHLPSEQLPTADVIVNPNLPNDSFASKHLAGVGVIFYVMLALRSKLRQIQWFKESAIAEPNMSQFLDLVALGTVADVVPLDYNNRILVHQGIQRIRSGRACLGIQALLNVSKRECANVVASDLGFAVAPRLNAAGRLEDMSLGIECLLAQDETTAMKFALQLHELNLQRREVEQSMQEDAKKIVANLCFEQEGEPEIYSLYDARWHQGVVGLVASRIKEATQRPVLAFAPSEQEGELKGSCRSVEGVHIRDLLVRVDALYPELIKKFGGHAMAAGLTIHADKLATFEQALLKTTKEFTKGHDWSQVIWTDGELEKEEFCLDFAHCLRDITPWGQAFEAPVFEGWFEVLQSRVVGESHAKLRLLPDQGAQWVDAIYFGYFSEYETLPEGRIRALFELDVNHYKDQELLQLRLKYIEQG